MSDTASKSNTTRARAILAEDEHHSRVLMKTILTSMKCEIVGEAVNGEEAVRLYRQHRPHLMLMDINMPVKTGDEALKEILAEFPDALVIMLTSVSDQDTIEECISLGAANYIRKDTSVKDIRGIIADTWKDHLVGQIKSIRRENVADGQYTTGRG